MSNYSVSANTFVTGGIWKGEDLEFLLGLFGRIALISAFRINIPYFRQAVDTGILLYGYSMNLFNTKLSLMCGSYSI
jgi:hypothetical protein